MFSTFNLTGYNEEAKSDLIFEIDELLDLIQGIYSESRTKSKISFIKLQILLGFVVGTVWVATLFG
ncbi:hypothetical protein CBW65_23690 [Tumebacillus avium]|uniref:Uncharacterized protein n=1 Tax=Tumebacillus avium TaxID=1903704 RepID=A0A1Y0ISW3_9BACL|nr:hypothetical protein CBW65_23690 [Tumebacillus avium]